MLSEGGHQLAVFDLGDELLRHSEFQWIVIISGSWHNDYTVRWNEEVTHTIKNKKNKNRVKNFKQKQRSSDIPLIVLDKEVTTAAPRDSAPDKKMEAPLTLSIWICGSKPLAWIWSFDELTASIPETTPSTMTPEFSTWEMTTAAHFPVTVTTAKVTFSMKTFSFWFPIVTVTCSGASFFP
jgi:hypothetical protein